MITRALIRYLRISPKKLRPILELIKKKKVSEAIPILANTNKKGAGMLRKAVESALSNAKRIPEKNFLEEDLFITKVAVDAGPALKRFRAMSMGRAGTIRKRTSHLVVELDAPEKAPDKTRKVSKKPRKFAKPAKARK